MGAILGPVVLVVVVAVIAVVMVRRTVGREQEVKETLAHPDVPSLRYRVPEGQDPAVVLSSLRAAGYVAAADDLGGGNSGLLVSSPDGAAPDREAVRAVIVGSPLNFEGDTGGEPRPRFEDE
jgi:hypothetical protein